MTPPPDAAEPVPFAPHSGEHYDAERSIGYQMARLVLAMRREAEGRMAALGLTDAQWKPLWLLKNRDSATALELAREAQMDAGAFTRLVDRLEAKGLLERSRSQTDRRVVLLKLTPAGHAVSEQVRPVLAAVNNDFLRGFSEADWMTLCDLLGRMAANGSALAAERPSTR